jgi:hypothetical protein
MFGERFMDDETRQLIEALTARVTALEADVGERHNAIEQGFNQRIDAVEQSVEQLGGEVTAWTGDQGSKYVHLDANVGDLAARVHALETGNADAE